MPTWRALIILASAFLLQAFSLGWAAHFQVNSTPIFVAPIILTYGIFFQSYVEGLATATVVGFILDVLSGVTVGTNMALMVIAWFVFSILASIIGRPQWWSIFGGIYFVSLSYRVGIQMLALFATGRTLNWEWTAFLFGPFFDAVFGILFLRFLHRILTWFKLVDEASDTLSRRQWT